MASPYTLIDTCCLLNLCAVDDPERILPQIPVKWYLARSVEREEISIRPRPDAKREERHRIDLGPCIASGVLLRCDLASDEERDLYINLAMEVDDGEAMSLAIASIRNWGVATDDMAAISVARRLGVKTASTPELLRLWTQHSGATPQQVAEAIVRIESLARFIPNVNVPGAAWWKKCRR